MMKTALCLSLLFYVLSFLPAATVKAQQPNVKISFVNCVGKQPLVLDSVYTNCWNENFSVTRLKYYISNIALQTNSQLWNAEPNSYHLVDEADIASGNISFYLAAGTYTALSSGSSFVSITLNAFERSASRSR